jgi:hypothetical protein
MKFVKKIENHQLLCNWIPDPLYRVPHITHCESVSTFKNTGRYSKAVAVFSNCSSPLRRFFFPDKAIELRVRLALHDRVDLYGRESSWHNYRSNIISPPRIPRNYKGEIAGYWGVGPKLDVISQYKAMVCLENAFEPYYFTEKFVDAVQAGCIPIYHAHETNRNSILKGAKWVDPVDFGFDIDETINFALTQNIEEYWTVNQEWIKSDQVKSTNFFEVFERIGNILSVQQ